MQTETISNCQNTEKNTQRQFWSKPDLIDYGTVDDLTKGGGVGGVGEALYVSTPP